MAGLATNFGLAPLIHARLAIIADARLSGRTDLAIVIERLLTISGEDAITIDRKHTAAWTGRLPTRLMLMSNELPRLADASGALASRFIPLILRESFLGREDIALEARVLAGLAAVFWWAVAGYRRLTARGRFIGTQAGQDAIDQLTDLASPVGAFVREWCVVKPGQQVARAELYDAWRAWCDGEGRQHTGDTAAFGRDLRAVVPGIGDTQPTIDGQRLRAYEGIGLTIAAQESARIWLSNRGAR
jgi:putative DNA primase/helicase